MCYIIQSVNQTHTNYNLVEVIVLELVRVKVLFLCDFPQPTGLGELATAKLTPLLFLIGR